MVGELAVELEEVSKSFGDTRALNGVSAAIPAGSICGVIGPNGSGKTTTLRIILNMILPDTGAVKVLGSHKPGLANNRISYLPEERGLYRKMRVRHQLEYLARLKGVERARIHERIQHWLERVGLPDVGEQKVETLSKGMAQKIQFAGTLINDPELIILDEPFSGLDPVSMELIRGIVVERKRAGATILFSTHDMAMAEHLCDSILMIYRGNKVLDGSLEAIQERYGSDTVRLRAASPLSEDFWGELLARDGGGAVMKDLGRIREFRGLRDPQAFLRAIQERTRVSYFEVKPPGLHDIFLRLVREEVVA